MMPQIIRLKVHLLSICLSFRRKDIVYLLNRQIFRQNREPALDKINGRKFAPVGLSIRTCQENNQIMFVGKDVAKALGYSNTSDALRKHVDDEDKGVAKCDTLGGTQKTTLINKSGLYALILALRACDAPHLENSRNRQ